MRRTLFLALGALALTAGWHTAPPAVGQVPDNPPTFDGPMFGMARRGGPESRFADFNTLVRGARVYDGLFRLHQKDENLYMEIKQSQLGQPFLCPIAVARGGGMGGY